MKRIPPIRIESKGAGANTSIYDMATGDKLPYVTKVTVFFDPRGKVEAVIERHIPREDNPKMVKVDHTGKKLMVEEVVAYVGEWSSEDVSGSGLSVTGADGNEGDVSTQ